MRNETNLNALKSDEAFIRSLLPSPALQGARLDFDRCAQSGTYLVPKLDRLNNICTRLTKAQYYPLIHRLVVAVLKDWKLSGQDAKAINAAQMSEICGPIFSFLRPLVEDQTAKLNVLNAAKPAIRTALKSLEDAGLVLVQRPRRKSWGEVSTYVWIGA